MKTLTVNLDKRKLIVIKPEAVREYRKSLKMSQKQFAVASGVSDIKIRKSWEVNGLTLAKVQEAAQVMAIFAHSLKGDE